MELLEIIGNINDLVWKWIFNFFKPISDNVAVVIIGTSVFGDCFSGYC